MNTLNIVLAIAVIAILYIVAVYNGLVRRRVRIDEAWADIDVQLKRRYDLVPNLVEIVKGYMQHERQVFESVTNARAAAMDAKPGKEKLEKENQFSQTLKTLFAVAENYPELKANQNFLELQRELTDTEDKIQASRRFYNANVRDYNIAIQSFPTSIMASIFGFKARELFGVEETTEREPVKIKF